MTCWALPCTITAAPQYQSCSIRKCRAGWMPGDTSSPRNTQSHQSHAEPEKRVLSQHTECWEQSRHQVIWGGKAYTDVKTAMKKPFSIRQQALWLPNAWGGRPLTMVLREFLVLVKEGWVRSGTNQTSITISTKNPLAVDSLPLESQRSCTAEMETWNEKGKMNACWREMQNILWKRYKTKSTVWPQGWCFSKY